MVGRGEVLPPRILLSWARPQPYHHTQVAARHLHLLAPGDDLVGDDDRRLWPFMHPRQLSAGFTTCGTKSLEGHACKGRVWSSAPMPSSSSSCPCCWCSSGWPARWHGPGGVALLTLASFVFYAYWDWRFLPLLLGSVLVNHLIAKWLLRAAPGAARSSCSASPQSRLPRLFQVCRTSSSPISPC